MNKTAKSILLLSLVVLGIILAITGHRVSSYTGLIIQLFGVASILVALYIYNKQYQ